MSDNPNFGVERFIEMHLNLAGNPVATEGSRLGAVIRDKRSPYKGMTAAQITEKARQSWLRRTPEQRREWLGFWGMKEPADDLPGQRMQEPFVPSPGDIKLLGATTNGSQAGTPLMVSPRAPVVSAQGQPALPVPDGVINTAPGASREPKRIGAAVYPRPNKGVIRDETGDITARVQASLAGRPEPSAVAAGPALPAPTPPGQDIRSLIQDTEAKIQAGNAALERVRGTGQQAPLIPPARFAKSMADAKQTLPYLAGDGAAPVKKPAIARR